MSRIILAVLASMVLMLFTGCSVAGNFNRDYVVNEVNPYYSKVSSIPVTIIPSYGVISKASETIVGKVVAIDMNTGETNNNVSRIFFEQYFSNVKTENASNKNGLIVKSRILDYKYYVYNSGGIEIDISLEVVAELNGKAILNKVYNERFDNEVLIRIFTLRAGKENVVDFFHKALLSLYENNVKKDLLQAL